MTGVRAPEALDVIGPAGTEPARGARILVAGEGHTAISVHRGLRAAGFEPSLCTDDTVLTALVSPDRVRGADLAASMAAFHPDVVVTAGWKPLVPGHLLTRARFLNVHHSLLPRHRGLHAVVWAVLNGDARVGVTLHEVDDLVDHGPIVWQTAVDAGAMTSWELMRELDTRLAADVGRVLRAYLDGRATPVAQDEAKATFVGRRHPDDSRIDWHWSATQMDRVLRALVPPYPRPFFEHRGERWTVVRAAVDPRDYAEIPGHVVYRDAASVWVKLGSGLLRLYEISSDREGLQAARVVFPVPGARLDTRQP